MASPSQPPRPVAPGDVVITFSDDLGEWTAAQITGLERSGGLGLASVLELDWSGPEPTRIEDVGPLTPLCLTHHRWTGQLWHVQHDWLLPRGVRVLGNAPLVVDARTNTYAGQWRLGSQLALQRRWDAGATSGLPSDRRFEGAEIPRLVAQSDRFPDLRTVMISDVEALDAAHVVALFPHVTRLAVFGDLGSLTGAQDLNRLTGLRSLHLSDLFEMTAPECLRVSEVPHLEWLELRSVPAAYARAMRHEWGPEQQNGTRLEIAGARPPGWVAENRDNPLRDWDGREHISPTRYRRSVAQYRLTRRAVLDQLAARGEDVGALSALGRDFAVAFNAIDGVRKPFIETEEREELLVSLEAIVRFCEQSLGSTFGAAGTALLHGAQDARAW